MNFERGIGVKQSVGLGIESQFLKEAAREKDLAEGWLQNSIIRKVLKGSLSKKFGIPVKIKKKRGKWVIQATIGGIKYEV